MNALTSLRQGFAEPAVLVLLVLLPFLGVASFLAARRRRRALVQFADLSAVSRLTSREAFAGSRAFLRSLGLGLLVFAIAGPRWGVDANQPVAPGRDLVVVLDLSRSMLAQDVLPSRQERVKAALLELADSLQQRGGHRVALVAFAARPRVICPLTHDYDHFRAALRELDAAEPPPDLRTPRGVPSGTRFGAALELAAACHDPRFRGYQDILMMSDGDDPASDEEWRAGVRAAQALGIPVHAVGIGDPDRDSVIPLAGDEPLQYRREVVKTRLREAVLRDVARLTDGTYTPARTQALPLAELFHARPEVRGEREADEDTRPTPRLRYAWFLGPAALFLTGEMLLGRRRARAS
jgi:Ca-activated chloride channel family protein